ncbi:MAG: transcriptional repressor [bacterium]|nr:transcriptional repressor [bacterium]
MEKNIDISPVMVEFEKVLRAKGLRITHQRTEIFKALLKHADHPTAENVFNQVRKHLKSISLDTVYRTIATFEEYGLIKRVHHIDNATRFDTNTEDHHHLVCSKCNKIEDFYWSDFDQMKTPKSISHWSNIAVKHVVIEGLCASCQSKK